MSDDARIFRFQRLPGLDRHALRSRRARREIIEQEISIGQTLVVSRSLNHPQGNLGFRIMDGEGVFAYVSDTEHFEDKVDERVVELVKDADVMVYDAQFTPEQYPQRKGWGHSTWKVGAELARMANVKTLVLFHHDPASTDDVIDRIVEEAVQYFPGTIAAARDLEPQRLQVHRGGGMEDRQHQ